MAELQKFFSLDYILNLFKNPQDMVLILIIGSVILISILFLPHWEPYLWQSLDIVNNTPQVF